MGILGVVGTKSTVGSVGTESTLDVFNKKVLCIFWVHWVLCYYGNCGC